MLLSLPSILLLWHISTSRCADAHCAGNYEHRRYLTHLFFSTQKQMICKIFNFEGVLFLFCSTFRFSFRNFYIQWLMGLQGSFICQHSRQIQGLKEWKIKQTSCSYIFWVKSYKRNELHKKIFVKKETIIRCSAMRHQLIWVLSYLDTTGWDVPEANQLVSFKPVFKFKSHCTLASIRKQTGAGSFEVFIALLKRCTDP